ncbi:MAG: pyridoxal-phosphate dependent enzyme, partial [Rhodospirillales bacterium]
RMTAVNSINWARVMAQIVYYFYAAVKVGGPGRPVAFAVPTGNFGNIFAGYAASLMGLPVRQLIIGSNRNDILTRFLGSGRMETSQIMPTLSPSMDIQASSNFERLLFELYGRDGTKVAALMDRFGETGAFSVDADRLRGIRALFDGERFDDEQTKRTIKAVYQESGWILDPHSAVGVAAGRAKRRDAEVPMVVLATAHPAKFPEAVREATGASPEPPPRLADLFERQERYRILPKDLREVQAFVLETLRGKRAA